MSIKQISWDAPYGFEQHDVARRELTRVDLLLDHVVQHGLARRILLA